MPDRGEFDEKSVGRWLQRRLSQGLRDAGALVASGCGMAVALSGTTALHDNVRSGEGAHPCGIFLWEHAPGP